jgi:hypothetical protein
MSLLKYAAIAVASLSAALALADDPYKAGADVSAAYQIYVDGLANGDAEAAAASLAEKVSMIAGDTCTPESPCVGYEAVKATFEGWVGLGLKDKLIAKPQVLGNMLVSRVEVTWNGIADMGVERILGTNFIEAENGKLTRKIFIPDSNDEQTMKFLKIAAPQ